MQRWSTDGLTVESVCSMMTELQSRYPEMPGVAFCEPSAPHITPSPRAAAAGSELRAGAELGGWAVQTAAEGATRRTRRP